MAIEIKDLQVKALGGDAASDIFLHVQTKRAGKIKGEGTTDGHADDIGLYTWGWGVSANTAIGSTVSTARRSYKHLVVTKGIDSASTGLLSALVTNDEVREATLAMRKGGGEALDYFRMTLNDARIVGVDIEVGTDGRPVERVAIAFTKIDIEYKRQQGAGLGTGSFSFTDEVMAT
jgi:type VI secretion system secreted protein Hcp